MSKNLVLDENPPKDAVKDEEQEKDANKVTKQSTDGCEECRTPESQKHKIPTIENCPPAPERSRKMTLGKGDSLELEFFENKGREEVEMFFNSCMDNSGVADGRFPMKKRLFDNS